MYARKQVSKTPNLTILKNSDYNWYAIVTLVGVPRIVCVEDWKIGAGGFTYVKCRMMLSGDTVWLEQSNIVQYVYPPRNIAKPCPIDLFDEVRLSDHKKAEIVAIHGDMLTVIDCEDDDAAPRYIPRWNILYVTQASGYSSWLDATQVEEVEAS